MLRRIFSEIPLFYNIYFHLTRKNRGLRPSYFTSSTDLFYDGYPRSGNTFLNHLMVNIFPNLNSVHHLHKVAPIKIALKKKIPVFILVRDPGQAIPSNYLKCYAKSGVIPNKININLLNRLTEDYYYYYRYVSKNKDRIFVVRFEELIGNTAETIKGIADKLNTKADSYNSLINKISVATDTYSGAKTKYGSSKPNQYKEQEKNRIKKELFTLNKIDWAKEVYYETIN